MNLKIQCPCGARYAFEVEPVDGRMPFAVKCPQCGADGTEAANALISEAGPATRLRVASVAVPVVVPAGEAASLAQAHETRRAVDNLLRQRKASEQKKYRWTVYAVATIVAAVVCYAGFWVWYYFSGSKPHIVYETAFGGSDPGPAVQFIAPNRFLLVDNQHAVLHDLKTDKDVWSASFSPVGNGKKVQLALRGARVWACIGNALYELDASNGSVKKMIPIEGDFETFAPATAGFLIVSSIDTTTRRVLRVSADTAEVASQDVTVPPYEKHEMPEEMPGNVAPTEGVLTAHELGEKKFGQPLVAMQSQFYSTGDNFVEVRTKLAEPKVAWVNSIKPDAGSVNGETSASTTMFGVSDTVFNQLKRSNSGGVKRVDQSRYEIKVRRWDGEQPVEWTGESTGPAAFIPLATVDLVACGKTLIALDKQNHFLFQANLSYAMDERFVTNGAASGLVPAIEGQGVLYFADQGVLTAFSLPSGQVRWRLTSIGVSKIQFDGQGSLYVDSTTASPQDIQFSDTISFDKAKPLLVKMDAQTGRILWQREGTGNTAYVSGKFLYASTTFTGGGAISSALREAIGNAPDPDQPVRFHLYRINPNTGQTLWDIQHDASPGDLSFQENKFVLCFDHDVQGWRAMSF